MIETKGYVTEEDIDETYVADLVAKITPLMQQISGEVNPIDEITIESTIYKVLIYINDLVLPKALFLTVAEMGARQLSEYKDGLSSERSEGAIKKIQRGGFTQEFETKQGNTSVPRGTQFMQDYVKMLNRFRRLRTI
ncbi:hypothetical protein PDK35_02365 [Bacillus cereus group sp. TH153LC]|uniref:hypothetical protein n=1 Tax=Bacillus cereus group sp. TH153LC TaxID=3018059 RepID=UPI0022E3F646|nr:hypothetical protein [Bacillus cereus group sp. TH153LC]MDA1658819.1 hypothetical protein [Bacillus cereus group sp. TH153LC]